MNLSLKCWMVGSIGVAAAWACLPVSTAKACSPKECAFVDVDSPVAPAGSTIASDGRIVLWVLDGYEGVIPEELTVEVSTGGVPTAGTIEYDPDLSVVVFVPDTPLAPGSYDVHVLSTETVCFGIVDETFAVEVVAQALPAASGPSPSAMTQYDTTSVVQLDTIVCCDGANPSLDSCGGIYVGQGACASAVDQGWLEVSIDVAPELSDIERADVVVTLDVDGYPAVLAAGTTTYQTRRDHAFCITPTLVHVTTGEAVAGDPQCFEPEADQPLGQFEIDPLPQLELECTGTPYVCSATDWEWDLENCVDFPGDGGGTGGTGGDGSGDGGVFTTGTGGGGTGDEDGELSGGDGSDTSDATDATDRGCSCRTTTAPASWAFGFGLVVLGLRRRR